MSASLWRTEFTTACGSENEQEAAMGGAMMKN
jgi:hypothetical protein